VREVRGGPAVSRGPNKWALLAGIFGVMVLADQATKFLAVDRLTWAFQRVGARTLPQRIEAYYTMKHLEATSRPPFVVWDPVWRMTYAENPGAAWGMLRDLPAGLRHGFFVAMSLAAVGFMLWYYRRLRPDQRWMQVAIALVLSGAVGNLLDRLARGYVVDFVQWHWWHRPDLYWPIFNLADSLIFVGVGMLLLHGDKRGQAAGKNAGTDGVQA
jgi:signal peptidase II